MNKFSVDTDGPVARITLTAPETGNKLDIASIKALTEAFIALGNMPEVKVIHLSNQGKDFCLGRQLPPVAPDGKPLRKSPAQIRDTVTDPILALYAAIRQTPVPVVASVTGAANGLGCALAVICDVTIATETARFSLPEMRSNLPPTLAISAVMHSVPLKAVSHLVYSTEEISASEALRLGLLSLTAPEEGFEAMVAAYLEQMAKPTRLALCAVKEYLNLAPGQDAQSAARYGANLLAGVLATQQGA
jgi:enoyl-CoA hydratase